MPDGAAVHLTLATSVTEVLIRDFDVVVRFDHDAELRIEDPIHIRSANGDVSTVFSDGYTTNGLAALTAVLDLHLPVGRVVELRALESGEIRILPADDDTAISAGPGTAFEPWELHVGTTLIVSLPDGGLVQFGP